MCGFYGINRNDRDLVKKGIDNIIHRGPDENNIINNSKYSVGHVRLSIVGLDNGIQPLAIENGFLVFNGEIYNFKEIIKKYELDKTLDCDTDVLGILYQRFGFKGMLDRIEGMFSIAVLTDDKIFLARDRYGQKPLYYSLIDGFFQFGSDLSSFKVDKKNSNISNVGLNYFLSFGFIPSPHSIWNNYYKVNPSEYIEFDANSKQLSIVKYYDLDVNNYRDNLPLEKLIDESVKEHNNSDVGSNLLLSGGVDSSLVAYSLPLKTTAYTVKWGDKDYDEVESARRIAKKLGRDLKEVSMTKGQLEKRLTNLMNYISEPFADDGIISLDIVTESLNKKGVKVVLTGDGADEIFGGYNRYNIDIYLKLFPLFLLRFFKIISSKNSLRNVAISKIINLKNTKPGFERHYNISQLGFNDHERKTILINGYVDIKNELSIMYNYFQNKSVSKGKYMFDLRFLIEGNMMVKSDRISMKSSIEFRSPFLSRKIVENALLSKKRNILFGIKKIRLKLIFIKIFGISMLQKKKGFGAPLDTVYKDEYNKMFNSILSNQEEPIWSLICHNEFLKVLKSNSHKYKRLSFHILVLNIWLSKNI